MRDWLLKLPPREGQIEALNRSYHGVRCRDRRDQEPRPQIFREGPAFGWGHFLEMRVGKTPTALNEYMLFKRDHGIKKLLVIAPNSYKLDWALEAEKFGVDIGMEVYESAKVDKIRAALSRRSEWALVVNYEVLGYKRHLGHLLDLVGPDTMLAADESVSVKNPSTGFFKGSHELSKECGVARVLSGKPIIQGPHDLWAQLRVAKQLNGFGFYPFRNTFCVMGGFKGKQVKGVKNEDRLNELLQSISFFARRRDWMDDHGVDYASYSLQLTPEQLRAYDEMEQAMFTMIEEGEHLVTADQIITKILRLQQISSGFSTNDLGETVRIVPDDKNPLFTKVRSLLDNEIKAKTIVVAHYTPTIEGLSAMLAPLQPQVIRGGMTPAEKVQAKETFNTDPNCRVIIGQIKAIKYGNTLMGSPDDPCLYTIFAENSYSLDDRAQAEQRNQGHGQVSQTTVIDFFANDTHRALIRALQSKEDVCAAVLGYARGSGILPPT